MDSTIAKIGVASTVITAICCFTPILVALLGAVGLSASLGWIDYVPLPALALFLGDRLSALAATAGGRPLRHQSRTGKGII